LVIVQKVPNGTRGKLKLYLKPANTSSKQGKVRKSGGNRPAQRAAARCGAEQTAGKTTRKLCVLTTEADYVL
jgi:hypothetical protein